MVLVSVEAQEELRAELHAAYQRLPVVRSRHWRGVGARSGARLSPQPPTPPEPDHGARGPPPLRPPASQVHHGDDSSEAVDDGTYWEALTRLGGQRLASEVQAQLVRYLKDLTVDEIETICMGDGDMARRARQST
jgi:hypothetical protein